MRSHDSKLRHYRVALSRQLYVLGHGRRAHGFFAQLGCVSLVASFLPHSFDANVVMDRSTSCVAPTNSKLEIHDGSRAVIVSNRIAQIVVCNLNSAKSANEGLEWCSKYLSADDK